MAHCYIILSKKLNKFYSAATDEPLASRLVKHNNQTYGPNHFTSTAADWQLFYSIKCENMLQALQIEKHIKKMKSSNYIRNLKLYPDITHKLLLKYPAT